MKRVLLLIFLASAVVSAQPPARRATNIAALLAYPGFYHLRPIVLVGTVIPQTNGELRVASEAGSVRLIAKGSAPDGLDEIHGEFLDLGRLKPDDVRLASIDVKNTFHVDPEGAWPKAGEVTAVMANAVTPATAPAAPSIGISTRK